MQRGSGFKSSRRLRARQEAKERWRSWERGLREGGFSPCEVSKQLCAAQLELPSASISRQDCGDLVVLLAKTEMAAVCGQDGSFWTMDEVKGCASAMVYFGQKKCMSFVAASQLEMVVDRLLRDVGFCLENGKQEEQRLMLDLQALSYFLFGEAGRCGPFVEQILKVLAFQLILEKHDEVSLSCLSATLNCIGHLLQRKMLKEENMADFRRALRLCLSEALSQTELSTIHQRSVDDDRMSLMKLKFMQASLRVAQGTLAAFGRANFEGSLSLVCRNLLDLLYSSVDTFRNEKEARRDESESEFSDSDVDRRLSSSKVLKQLEKVRLTAFEFLQGVCEQDRDVIQAQLEHLFPQHHSTVKQDRKNSTLMTIAIFDGQPRIRKAALALTKSVLRAVPFRMLLSQARVKTRTGAFVSLSTKMSLMAVELHKALGFIIRQENNPSVQSEALSCIECMFEVMPYEKPLNEKEFLQEFATDETFRLIIKMRPEVLIRLVQTKSRLESVAGIMRRVVIQQLKPTSSYRLASALFLHYATEMVEADLWNSWLQEETARKFRSNSSNERRDAISMVRNLLKSPESTSLSDILSGSLPRALKDPNMEVRTAAALCLGEVPATAWACVSIERQNDCVRSMLDACKSDRGDVVAASLTALAAMFISTSSFASELGNCVFPVIESSFSRQSAILRFKAAVLLANLVSSSDQRSITCSQRLKAVSLCLSHASDNEKVASACFRALGFLIAQVEGDLLPQEEEEQVLLAMIYALRCPEQVSAKTRWNILNSFSHILCHPKACSTRFDRVHQEVVYCLCHDVNFKVRIAAAKAIEAALQAQEIECVERIHLRENVEQCQDAFVKERAHVDVAQVRFSESLSRSLETLLAII